MTRRKYEGVAGRLSIRPTPDDLEAGIDAIFELLRLLDERTRERDEWKCRADILGRESYNDRERVRDLEAALRRIQPLTKANQPERFDDVAREIHNICVEVLADCCRSRDDRDAA